MIGPKVQHQFESVPVWRYWVARIVIGLMGWDVDPDIPQVRKAVMIAAPHTSNWDAVLMLVAGSVYRVKVRFLAKESAFKGPVGAILRTFGGIPIDRSGNLGIVGQAAAQIRASDRLLFAVAASGTRKKAPRWKSGFYWIAREADVPICCGYLDYSRKIAGLGPVVYLTGDVHTDMDAIRAAYVGKVGYRPEQHTPIRIKEEEEAEAVEPPAQEPPPSEDPSQDPPG